jgi:hypothetical protein
MFGLGCDACAGSGYSLSVSSPTSGQQVAQGSRMSVSGSFSYPWPCLGLTCSPYVWLTMTGPSGSSPDVLWYNLQVPADAAFGGGAFQEYLTIYANMLPFNNYIVGVWLTSSTTNPGSGGNVLALPAYISVTVVA